MQTTLVSRMKLCKKCGVEKPTSEFPLTPRKSGISAPSSPCKPCRYIQIHSWQKRNWSKVIDWSSKYYYSNKKKHHRAVLRWKEGHYAENPWIPFYYRIRQRCLNLRKDNFKYYGGKGIKCLITINELKEIWFRDKAYLLDNPSIDRIDSNGHYEMSNCQFIEMSENISRAHRD